MNDFDVLIIGGGAAGFFAAINTAALNSNLKIAILERGSNVLSKVKISGGGRCNVTHAEFNPQELVLNYPRGEKELRGPFHNYMTPLAANGLVEDAIHVNARNFVFKEKINSL